MDNIVREVLKTKIMGLKATAFQDALDRIYLSIYGEGNFQRVKQKHDGGSDGIINGETVLAVYAPEKYILNDFKRKVRADFESYTKNWEATHSKWEVVTNLESTAQMIQFVNMLKNGASLICIDGLLQKIGKQTWTVKTAIFRALDIPDHYLSNDVISTVIEDLIQISTQDDPFEPYEKPAYIQDKIELNVSEEHVATFMDEYEDSLAIFPIVSTVVKSKSNADVAAIRNKVRSTYTSLSGKFEKRLDELVKIMCQSKSIDDYYSHNMRIVMVYFFEQCLFGKKPKSEVNR
ncbi:hypothetical protein [Spartinivicinus ruber]|uniref:hypothetical protein n=1 Tax=Spartinivicinus ruber TaxID=2683272 RepID=UPI0013D8A533|nr:hypothetical protein [Spartinivicinus ruber]